MTKPGQKYKGLIKNEVTLPKHRQPVDNGCYPSFKNGKQIIASPAEPSIT